MQVDIFSPRGQTVALAVTTTSHVAVNVPATGDTGADQYRIQNSGPNETYVNMGPDGQVAASAIPVDGTPQFGMPIPAGATEVFSGPPNAWFTAICAAAESATIFITPGKGG